MEGDGKMVFEVQEADLAKELQQEKKAHYLLCQSYQNLYYHHIHLNNSLQKSENVKGDSYAHLRTAFRVVLLIYTKFYSDLCWPRQCFGEICL